MENENTTIWISKTTKARLDSIGNFKESYDDVLNRIINSLEDHRIKDLTKNDRQTNV